MEAGMIEFPDIPGRRIANGPCETGPLVLPAHGPDDMHQAYRFPAPQLTRAGCQPAAMDMRGHGEHRPADRRQP
jgi:alpha-beta hydrolase superfamily lysophospholipase